MLRMSWMKSEFTGKLRARWSRTAAPSLPAGTLHALRENSLSQMRAADGEPDAGIAERPIAARDGGEVEQAGLVKVTVF